MHGRCSYISTASEPTRTAAAIVVASEANLTLTNIQRLAIDDAPRNDASADEEKIFGDLREKEGRKDDSEEKRIVYRHREQP